MTYSPYYLILVTFCFLSWPSLWALYLWSRRRPSLWALYLWSSCLCQDCGPCTIPLSGIIVGFVPLTLQPGLGLLYLSVLYHHWGLVPLVSLPVEGLVLSPLVVFGLVSWLWYVRLLGVGCCLLGFWLLVCYLKSASFGSVFGPVGLWVLSLVNILNS